MALLVSQVSRLIYKDKFPTNNSSYECGFSSNCNNIEYHNKLNSIIPKFIILEIILIFIITFCYLFTDKIILSILLFILYEFSIYCGKKF